MIRNISAGHPPPGFRRRLSRWSPIAAHSPCDMSAGRLREAADAVARGNPTRKPSGQAQEMWPGRHPRRHAGRERRIPSKTRRTIGPCFWTSAVKASSAASSRCDTKLSSSCSSVTPVAEPCRRTGPDQCRDRSGTQTGHRDRSTPTGYSSPPLYYPSAWFLFQYSRRSANRHVQSAATPCGRTRLGTGRIVGDEGLP